MLSDHKSAEKSQKGRDHDKGEDPKDRPDSVSNSGRRVEVSLRDHRLVSLTINHHHRFRQEGGLPRILHSVRHFHYFHSPVMCRCEGSVPHCVRHELSLMSAIRVPRAACRKLRKSKHIRRQAPSSGAGF